MHHYGMLCQQYVRHFDECALEGMSCCAFMSNANPGIDAVMIECRLCGQWVHDACARIDAKKIRGPISLWMGQD
jgi:hypothetical protein